MNELERLIKEIKEDNTLVLLEELGRLDIDSIDEDLDLFIEALEQINNKEYHISFEKGGQFIREYKRY